MGERHNVFMSTHILSDIEALCDQVAILRKEIAATGNLDGLLSEAARRKFMK
jgi:ABC-type multidrug transport system ATPase subunit